MSMEPDWLTLKEFAKRTHYAVQTVYNKISNGELTEKHGLVTFPSGRHRIDYAIWRQWLAAGRDRDVTTAVPAK
jgi:hypothetical protein